MMRQLGVLFWFFAAMTLAAGVASAEDYKGGKGKKKYSKKWHKELGKNVLVEVTVEGDDGEISISLVTALEKYYSTASAEGRHMKAHGFVKVKDDGFLVRCNVEYTGGRSKSTAGTDVLVDASMLLKDGEEAVFGKSGKVTIKVKVKELK